MWRAQLVRRVADLATGWPYSVIVATLAISMLSALYASRNLTLDANTDSLISIDRPFMQRYREFMREFGDLEYLYVAVDARGDPEMARSAIDALTIKLAEVPGLPAVHAHINEDEQWRLAPRAMATESLQSLLGASDGFAPLARSASHGGSLGVLEEARERLSRLQTDGFALNEVQRERLGGGALFMLRSLTARLGDGFELAQPRPAQYLVSTSGQFFFIEILPRKDFAGLATIEPILADIREVIRDVQFRFPTVDIGLTGKPVLQADELATTNEDMTRGTVVAAILVAILTMWTLGSLVRPLLVMGMLALTFACTYGAAAVLVGRLNLLSLVFMLVLVSAGVDYGIHTVARYTEFRLRLPVRAAMRAAIVANTIPTWVGALTSASVFLLALGTEFGGLRELGLIAGTGLIACAIILTIALPSLIIVVDEWRERRRGALPVACGRASVETNTGGHFFPDDPCACADSSLRSREAPQSDRQDRRTLIAGAALTLSLAAAIPWLTFETNLLRLQADGLDSIAWEHRILEDSVSASWFGGIICSSQVEVADVVQRAQGEPLIAATHSVLDLVQSDTAQRVELREKLGTALDMPRVGRSLASATPPTDLNEQAVLEVHTQLQGLIAMASLSRSGEELSHMRRVEGALKTLAADLADPSRRAEARDRASTAITRTIHALDQIGRGARATLRESLPSAVRDRLVADDGNMLVSLFPKEDIWEFKPMEEFVAALREIDPSATGVPMTVYESVVDMRSAFVAMSAWSVVVIALVVWIDLRSTTATVTCLACLALGMAWTFGALTLLGVSLNLANFFSVPMLLGFGIDSCVHVIHRAREGGASRTFGWTTRAVVLSAVTTAVGFGTLLFASHKGLQSLGWVMCIGSSACVICAVVVLPAALRRFPALLGLPPADALTTSPKAERVAPHL